MPPFPAWISFRLAPPRFRKRWGVVRPGIANFRRRHAALWTLLAGFAATAGLTWTLHLEALELDRARMIRRAGEIQNQLDAQLEKSELVLNNLRDFLGSNGEPRGRVLDLWCRDHGLTFNCRWMHAVLVATNRHNPEWRHLVPVSPKQWSLEDWSNLHSLKTKQPVECEIAVRSTVTNGASFLDDYQLRGFGHGVDQFSIAVKNSRLTMSDRRVIMLDAQTNGIAGTVFYVPIYDPVATELIASLEQSEFAKWSSRAVLYWMLLRSVIVAPVEFDSLLEAVRGDAPLDLGLEIFSSTDQGPGTWLGNRGGTPLAVDPTFKPYLSHRQPWRMYGRDFSIFFYTTPLFEAQSPRRLVKTAGWAGFAIALLAAGLVGVSVKARHKEDALTAQIREARDALAAAQRERVRISRDLHDGTIQSLYAIQLGLGHTAKRLGSEPAHAGSELFAVRRDLDAVIAEIRQFITAETDEGSPKSVDLGSVLQALSQRAVAGTQARVELRCDPSASARVTADQAVHLANIAREALSNALRHGRPTRVHIDLKVDGETVVLEVADDGIGFLPESVKRTGVGLVSMATRAAESGGSCNVRSSPGRGTHVVVRLPLGPAEKDDPEADDTEERDDEEPA